MTQETFLRAHHGWEGKRDDRNLKGWLFTIAANLWKNEVRRRTASKRQGWEESVDVLEASGVELRGSEKLNPYRQVLDKERRQQLYSGIESLPEQMRRCLQLRVVQGLKYREIATALQISVNTVKSQIFQARDRLKIHVGKSP